MSTIKIVTSCGKMVEVRGESLVLELIKEGEPSPKPCETPPLPRQRQTVEEKGLHWTKKYNFGDTFMGPVYRGAEDMDIIDDDDPDGMEIDY